jgi:hypothetical protein
MQILAFLRRVTVLALLAVAPAAMAGSQVVKCVIDGRVTFQNTPCPVDKPAPRPTLDELNADRKKRALEAQARAASEPKAGTPSPSPAMRTEPPVPDRAPPRDAGFRCDGRTYCSQMRSCAEARFFLARCPGVKMDGDGDGIPCEEQWCPGPLAR